MVEGNFIPRITRHGIREYILEQEYDKIFERKDDSDFIKEKYKA
jgi:hypothetical protein